MADVSFGSVYRIPITQAGVNNAKKVKLRELINSYPNGLIGKSKTGHARISVPDKEDSAFVAKLKAIGYKMYQKIEGDNISRENLDVYIKEKLDSRTFSQKGKQFKRMSTELKEKRRFERNYTPSFWESSKSAEDVANVQRLTADEIRQSKDYLEYQEKYGTKTAEAICFGINK